MLFVERNMQNPQPLPLRKAAGGRVKFIIGGLLILAAVIYLVVSSTQASAQYFMTVAELNEKSAAVANRELRVSGAVLGDTIAYDAKTLQLSFTVVHIPGDNNEIEAMGGIAEVLHQATLNPDLPRLQVVYEGVMPDLLKNEAQAIMTGRMDAQGVFHAEELLLKCPTRYEEAVPEQAQP
jgi:cytochrome c-type biogenesis protein CcmE